jgi:hypothetical protein
LTISETVILMPRMQARPPISFASNVMRSNIPEPMVASPSSLGLRGPGGARTVAEPSTESYIPKQDWHTVRKPCRAGSTDSSRLAGTRSRQTTFGPPGDGRKWRSTTPSVAFAGRDGLRPHGEAFT